MEFRKLVRDRIPEIIEKQGEKPVYRILNPEEYTRCLEEKLDEEVREFHADRNIGELADILEVLIALADDLGYSEEKLMDVRRKKQEERGSFQKRIFLISKET